MNSLKHKNMMAAYDGFAGPDTVEAVKVFVPVALFDQLTGKQLGFVMSAINEAYQAGKASCKCEVIDDDAIWIDQLQALVPIEDIKKCLES